MSEDTTEVVQIDLAEELKETLEEENIEKPEPKVQVRVTGKREIGHKKMRLLIKLQSELTKLVKQGINANYVLAKMTDYNGPFKTTTKQLPGVINQIKNFQG